MISRSPLHMAPGTTTSGRAGTRSIMDETEYLLSSPANARRLLESVNEINSLVDVLGGTRKEPAERSEHLPPEPGRTTGTGSRTERAR